MIWLSRKRKVIRQKERETRLFLIGKLRSKVVVVFLLASLISQHFPLYLTLGFYY